MAKGNAKSVRLSDEVLEYINNAPGDGFNQKFENIILDAKKKEPELRERLKSYEKKIQTKQVQLEKISKEVYLIDDSVRKLFNIEGQIQRLQKQISDILDDSS